MPKLVYYQRKIQGFFKIPIFVVIAMVALVIFWNIKIIASGKISEDILFNFLCLFTTWVWGGVPIWWRYMLSRYSKNVAIYEDHVEIEEKDYRWQDIVEIKQCRNIFSIRIKFKDNGNIDVAFLNNEYTLKDIKNLFFFDETELVKKIKEIHSRNSAN